MSWVDPQVLEKKFLSYFPSVCLSALLYGQFPPIVYLLIILSSSMSLQKFFCSDLYFITVISSSLSVPFFLVLCSFFLDATLLFFLWEHHYYFPLFPK